MRQLATVLSLGLALMTIGIVPARSVCGNHAVVADDDDGDDDDSDAGGERNTLSVAALPALTGHVL